MDKKAIKVREKRIRNHFDSDAYIVMVGERKVGEVPLGIEYGHISVMEFTRKGDVNTHSIKCLVNISIDEIKQIAYREVMGIAQSYANKTGYDLIDLIGEAA
ncbi:MAG: hypothetical protein AABW91_01240 [Nanoarchaeota archaeon]